MFWAMHWRASFLFSDLLLLLSQGGGQIQQRSHPAIVVSRPLLPPFVSSLNVAFLAATQATPEDCWIVFLFLGCRAGCPGCEEKIWIQLT